MELRHLRYFLAVAETGNVTRAAERCFVAQSALSSQIARLETELGSDLFVRSTRGMRLTPAGEALRPRAVRLLAEAGRLQEEMAALRGVLAGRLRIGMIQGAPPALDIVGLLAAFHDQHPGIELFVRTGASDDLARDVADGNLDVAVVAERGPDLPASLTVTPLIDDPLVAVVAPACPLPAGCAVSVSRLVEHGPFIHYQRGSGLRHSVTAAFDRAGVEVDASYELDQIADMVRLAALGAGVTIVPTSAVHGGHLTEAHAHVLPLQDEAALHTVSAVSASGVSAAALAFLGLLRPAKQAGRPGLPSAFAYTDR